MAKIGDWTINGAMNGRSTVFLTEDGLRALVRYEDRDQALIQVNGQDLSAQVSDARIIVNAETKTITVTP